MRSFICYKSLKIKHETNVENGIGKSPPNTKVVLWESKNTQG